MKPHQFLIAVLIIFFESIICVSTNAQVNRSKTAFNGIDIFTLGASKIIFKDSLTPGNNNKFEYKGKTFFSYSFGSLWTNPYSFLDIKFKSIILTFENDNILNSVGFLKFYLKNDTLNNTSEIRKDIKNIRKHFEKEFDIKFKKENIFNIKTTKNFNYAWENSLIKVAIQYSEHQYSKNKKNCSVSLDYFLKDGKIN